MGEGNFFQKAILFYKHLPFRTTRISFYKNIFYKNPEAENIYKNKNELTKIKKTHSKAF